jgi:hypothetical protein
MLADEISLPERDVRPARRTLPARERPELRLEPNRLRRLLDEDMPLAFVHREFLLLRGIRIGSSAETPGRGEKPSASAEIPIVGLARDV